MRRHLTRLFATLLRVSRPTTPTLESFRADPLVGHVGYVYGNSAPQPLLFHESANAAFYITLDALWRLQAVDVIGGNPYVIPALGLWFQATESYVSTIYKVAHADHTLRLAGSSPARNPKPAATQRVVEKYTAIEDYFGAPEPHPDAPRVALAEFATLRNVLFHDLTGVKHPSFQHTMFSANVENVNEVDLLQAMIVSIDVFTFFRHVFPQADLMPSIQIGAAFEKLDVLADEVAFPAFREILAKKGLTTKLVLRAAVGHTAATAASPIQLIIRAAGPSAPKPSSTIAERIPQRYVAEAMNRRPVPDDLFHVPKYTR
jgi:hypothetical protein